MASSLKALPVSDNQSDLLHDHISDRVTRIADLLIRMSSNLMKELWNLRHTDLRILDTLEMREPATINEISRIAMLDQAWVSRSLAMLEENKLVKRKQNPTDSRSSHMFLTGKGRTLLDKVRPIAAKSESILLAGIDEQALKQLLDRLEANVNDLHDNPDQLLEE